LRRTFELTQLTDTLRLVPDRRAALALIAKG
jgi:hypothetical protein